MKICYLANAASIHTVRWARHFANRGHEVIVISFQFGKIEGVRSICLSSAISVSRSNIVRILPKLRHIVREIKPDILHIHYITSYGVAGVFSGWRPLIATAWGDDILISPEKSLLYRVMVHWVLAHTDLVTSMANHMTNFMIERNYATPNKILTLPFGVDVQEFNLSARTRRLNEEPVIVISTRHLMPGYDIETLIRAIPLVLNQCSSTHFLIIGDGNLRPYLQKLAIHTGVQGFVDFLGKRPHNELPYLLGNADIFVTTSISDGNNVSLNEAMACGVFPIVSDIPANREWIEQGKNGLIFPVGGVSYLAEAIVRAIRQPKWRQWVANYNWELVNQRGSWEKNMDIMEAHYFHLYEAYSNERKMGML